MITTDPYGISHVIRPGPLPEPLISVSTRDPQDAVDRCLNCSAEECYGNCAPTGSARYTGERMDVRRRRLRDEQIRLMLLDKQNVQDICSKLGISRNTLFNAKRRLRERGDIT